MDTCIIHFCSYYFTYFSETALDERRCHSMAPSNLSMFPTTYSQNLCLMECRLNFIIKKCRCIPHFYFNRNIARSAIAKISICNVTGLNCIYRFARQIRKIYSNSKTLPSTVKCQCYPNCINQIIVTEVKIDTGNNSIKIN